MTFLVEAMRCICYTQDNTPATPLFPLCGEMMRNYGGFFIALNMGLQA